MRWLAVVLLAGLAALAAPGANAPQNRYVGTDICMKCHIDYARLWASVKHSQAMLAPELPAEKRGCEACHGPGAEHSLGRRKTIVAWDKLEVPEQAGICLQCHQAQGVVAELWTKSPHAELLSCSQCHEVHRPVERDDLLKPEEGKECSPCHDDLAQRAAEGLHHTLADGALACNMCHTFHGSTNERLLKQPQADLCNECHGDEVPQPESHKRDDFKLKHAADAKGKEDQCYTCHSQAQFCNQCHAVKIPHPEDFAVNHKDESNKNPQTCLRCHTEDYCKQCHEEIPAPVGKGEQAQP